MDPLELYDELRMAGRAPDPVAFAAKYPKHKNLLERITQLEALHQALDCAVAPTEPPHGWPKRVGRYTLGRLLGEGGMGAVFETTDGRAVKLLRDAAYLDRFQREATLALEHPSIARVYELGRDGEQAFMVTELIVGRPATGPAPLEDVRRWALQLCDALGYAHGRGVIHRDVKPKNVLIDQAGRARLIDFGLALSRDQAMTRSGVFLGSYNYAAPEQLESDRASVGPWTDVFGLGATLYELLTGKRAFDYPTFFARALAAGKKAPRLKKSPLSAAISRALEVQPKKRWQDMASFAAALSER